MEADKDQNQKAAVQHKQTHALIKNPKSINRAKRSNRPGRSRRQKLGQLQKTEYRFWLEVKGMRYIATLTNWQGVS